MTGALSIRHWSLRRLLATLLAILGILVAGLFLVASLQVGKADSEAASENRRAASFLIADGMRQSSNDLTNMVRLHVATGQQRYRDYYDEILSIRDGTTPRPRGYTSSFWDRVLAEGKGFVRYGPRQSLIAQMREARFAPAEFRALESSLRTSNTLAALERDVMRQVAPRIADGVDASYARDIQDSYQRLVDGEYLSEKGRIMRSIERFTDLVEQRTLREVRGARDDTRTLALVQIGIIGLIVLLGIAAMALLARLALRPLARLTSATRRIAAGDYGERVDIDAVADLEHVADAFNDMSVAIATDVAKREAAEHEAVLAREAAEQANQAKTKFLAAMSHEIRTPMIGVTGMLELIAHSDLTRQQQAMVATADRSARSLLQIIGDVLDFSKIEADRLELAPTTIDLRAVIATSADTFARTASAKGLLLTWSVEDSLAPAHVGDPLRLRQIVTNLLSNAIKFTEVGGIDLRARVIDRDADGTEHIEVTVTDTGVGVTPEQQQRLFAEFGQAESSTTHRYGGTGLGLAICRRLAVLMGGDVTMDSAAGKGTTMRLLVPLAAGDPAAIDPRTGPVHDRFTGNRPKPSRAVAEEEGSLLLLAEDHPVNRTVISQQLDLIGFHVDVAENGEAAFEAFMSGRYALVLTDLNMPKMNGYELADAIRRYERRTGRQRTSVIALSANVMRGEPEKTRAAGMDDFMAKPTTMPFMASKLKQWLSHLEWETKSAVAPAGGNGADSGEAPIDAAALELLTGGDDATARAVLADFLATTRDDVRSLHEAIGTEALEDTRRLAHRIKGAALMVGAGPLSRTAQRLESAAGANGHTDWSEMGELADRLADDLAHCV